MRDALDALLSSKWRQFAAYVLLFTVAAVGVCIWFFFAGKSFVWEGDGVKQHFNCFVYLGRWARSIVSGFFSTGCLNIPLFEFSIGYGSDVISTFSYYGLGEPLVWLSVLCPSDRAEVLYSALIVVRLFLAGFFFMAYCRYSKRNPTGSTIAAVVYAFSSWALYAGFRHPFFLVPLVFLPLLLLGAEKIIKKESPLVFIVAVFLSALCNFYFFYMLTIAVFLYVLVRFICMPHNKPFREFAALFVRFLACGVIGFMMAGVLMLPVLLTYASSARSVAEVLIPPYSFDYYASLFTEGFTTSTTPGAWSYPGVSAPAMLAVVLLFANKGNRELKIAVVLMIAFLCIPQAAYVFNAMSFVSNRWTWMVAFTSCFALVTMWERMTAPRAKDVIVLLFALIVYMIAFFALGKGEVETAFASMVLMLVTFGCTLVFFLADTFSSASKGRRPVRRRAGRVADMPSCALGTPGRRHDARGGALGTVTAGKPAWATMALSLLMVALLVFGTGMNAYYLCSSTQGAYVDEFIERGAALSATVGKKSFEVGELIANDGTFSRFDSSNRNQNSALNAGVSTTSFYWSLCEGTVSDYLRDMAHYDARGFGYRALNRRTFLNSLASVGYCEADEGNVPYGYSKLAKTLYKNDYALPLGYTYSSAIPTADYAQMNALEKQEALMQSVVYSDDASGLESGTVTSSSCKLDYTVSAGSDVDGPDSSTFVVGKAGSSITLNVDCPANEEIYLYARGVEMEAKPLLDLYLDDNQNVLSKSDYDNLSDAKKESLDAEKSKFSSSGSEGVFRTRVSCGGVKSYFAYRSPYVSHYNGQKDFAVCLGISNKERHGIKVKFPYAGVYNLGDVAVYAQPMTDYASQVSKLKENTLENVEIGTNEVTGSISLSQSKALLLTIPYSQGWSATVDGKPAELHQANGMFMALTLDAGEHRIELKYRTRGLLPGTALSFAGFAVFAAIAYFWRKLKRRSFE